MPENQPADVPEELKLAAKKFINDNFTVIDKKYFNGMQLWYLKRKDNTTLKASF